MKSHIDHRCDRKRSLHHWKGSTPHGMIPRSPSFGFTLIELMVAIAAATILLAGLTSALFMACRVAIPEDDLVAIRDSSEIAYGLMDEVQHAIFLTEKESNSIGFAVADMTGDNQPDVVRYAWSGTAGDPLQKSVNHGTAQTVLTDVQQFGLGYSLRGTVEDLGPLIEEGSTITHSQLTTGSSTKDFDVQEDAWIGERITPLLPVGTVSWSVNEVEVELRKKDPTGGFSLVQLRPATGSGIPTSTVLDQKTVWESSLTSSYAWYPLNLSALNLAPSDSICLVIRQGLGTAPCSARYENYHVAMPNHGRLESTDEGSSWSLDTDEGLHFKLRGTVSIAGPTQTITRNYVTGVRATLRSGLDTSSRIQTATPLLNSPEVLNAYWESDFDTDPTTADVNYDGNGDWVVEDGSDFDTDTLVDGAWEVNSETLNTQPMNQFVHPVTIDVRMRNTSAGGDGARFKINWDWSRSTRIATIAQLKKRTSSSIQDLTLFKKTDAFTEVPVHRVTNLSLDFVDLRLVLLPASEGVHISVNGNDQGCYKVPSIVDSDTDAFASILESGSNAEFDYISVRVSE